MSDRTPAAFMLSAALHAGVALLIAYFTYVASQRAMEEPKIFELVAGEGDNYLAKAAPALGTPDGVKVDIPKQPEPRPAPPQLPPAADVPPPVMPAPKEVVKPLPAPKTPPKPADPSTNFAQQIKRRVANAEAKVKREAAKERAAEAKRLEQEQKRLTKEEFDRANANKAKTPPAKSGPTKVAKIDAAGIAKGVVGGSRDNKTGGAGGRALVASDGAVMEAYFALLKQKVRTELAGLAGMDDQLVVTVIVHISANGALSRPRVEKSSGNEEFDRAVIAAFARIRMPEHPEKKAEDLILTFRTRDIEDR